MKEIKKLREIIGKLALSFAAIVVLTGVFTLVAVMVPIDIEKALQAQPLFFMFAVYVMFKWFDRNAGWTIGWKDRQGWSFAIHGMAAGILLIAAASFTIWLSGSLSWKPGAWDDELVLSLLKGIAFYILVAIGEEVYFRGYAQGLLRHHYGSRIAIMVSSVWFALMHGMNSDMFQSPLPFLNITLVGILFAIAREWTGSLWYSIGLHFTWNLFQGHVFGYSVSGTDLTPSVFHATFKGPAIWNGGAFGAEGSIATTVVVLIGILGTHYHYRGLAANRAAVNRSSTYNQ